MNAKHETITKIGKYIQQVTQEVANGVQCIDSTRKVLTEVTDPYLRRNIELDIDLMITELDKRRRDLTTCEKALADVDSIADAEAVRRHSGSEP